MRPLFLSLLFLCLFFQSGMAQPVKLKVMTYNLRYGELASMEQLGAYIKSHDPDIVLLQEVDVFTNRQNAKHQNGKNFVAELGYFTNMLSVYSKSIDFTGGYYGLAILSKYPFESMQRYKLALVEQGREQRCLLTAKVEINEKNTVTVACTHLDLKPEIRLVQVQEIDRILKDCSGPIVLGGDFNAEPDSREMALLMTDWMRGCNNDYTIPVQSPNSKIDYIFCFPKKSWNRIDAEVPYSGLSDHLPVISTLELYPD